MWFINKETNHKWHITNKELQERLLSDSVYEVIEEEEVETKEEVKEDQETQKAGRSKKEPKEG